MTNRFTLPALLLLPGFYLLAARPAAADDKEKSATTRPVISEEVAPLEAITPVAKDNNRGEAYLRKPPGDGPFPAVVLVHGGIQKYPTAVLKELALGTWTSRFLAAGYVVAVTTYRSRDVDPQTRDSLEDVLATIDHLRKLSYVDSRSIVVNGCSGGGDLALSVAVERDVSVIVPEEPASMIFTGIFNKQFPKKGDRLTPQDSDPIMADPKRYYTAEYQKLTREKIAKIRCPILIVQGDRHPVNRFNAEILLPELRAGDKTVEVFTYKGEPHCFAFYSTPSRTPHPDVALTTFEGIDGYLRKLLKTKPVPIDPKLGEAGAVRDEIAVWSAAARHRGRTMLRR